MTNIERFFLRTLMGLTALLLLAAAAWPGRLLQVVLGAGPPQAGEQIPRQIPYRGYLEENGVAVTASALEFGFSLTPSDGGAPWRDVRAVEVQNGNFSVDLGDDGGIPAQLLDDPGVSLSIQVRPSAGGPVLVGSQRLLSVPFSQRSKFAWRAQEASLARGGFDVSGDLVVDGGVRVFGSAAVGGAMNVTGMVTAAAFSAPSKVVEAQRAAALPGPGPTAVVFQPGDIVQDTAPFFQGGSVFLAPRSGLYLVIARGGVAFGAANWVFLNLLVDGSSQRRLAGSAASATAGILANGSAVVHLNAGQTLQLTAQSNGVDIHELAMTIVHLGD